MRRCFLFFAAEAGGSHRLRARTNIYKGVVLHIVKSFGGEGSEAMLQTMSGWRGTVRRMTVAAGLLQIGSLQYALANAPAESAADASRIYPPTSFLTQRETWAALAVLVFGLVIGMLALLVMRNRTLPPEDVIRLSAMILIVTGTLFLVTAGYSAGQIAPALGLLGTVAGYMLGRADRSSLDRSNHSRGGADGKDT